MVAILPYSNIIPRRNDLLSEDLLLENKYETACKKAKVPAKKRKKTSKSSKRNYEPGTYHYIAFVPVDGQVWELDGLESMPLSLGSSHLRNHLNLPHIIQ